MAFLKRLGWYLVGLSIGIVFLAFFLKKKSEETGTSFCYFPNCRVLKDIRSKPISYAEEVAPLFKTDSITFRSFFENGSVDFGKSDTKSEPCKIYFITNEEQTIKLKNCPDKVEVVEIY